MKSLLILFICLVIVSCQRPAYTVSSEKNNVLYSGLDNPLKIVANNVSPKSLVAKTDNGILTGENGHYIFRTDTGSTAVITLYKKKLNGLKEIGKCLFHVRQRPDPRAYIGPQRGGKVSLAQIRSYPGINTGQSTYIYERETPISSFTFSIIRNNEYVYREIKNEGAAFTKEVGLALANARPGDSLVFNNIFARRDDGTTTILEPITFLIIAQQ